MKKYYTVFKEKIKIINIKKKLKKKKLEFFISNLLFKVLCTFNFEKQKIFTILVLHCSTIIL